GRRESIGRIEAPLTEPPFSAPPAALPPPGTARTTSVTGVSTRTERGSRGTGPARRRQRTDLGDRRVRVPLRPRAPSRDWESARARPVAGGARPATSRDAASAARIARIASG